ncbi:MAG: hypothetical protein ACYC7E_17040, partial [Armatimonadota bacterium]
FCSLATDHRPLATIFKTNPLISNSQIADCSFQNEANTVFAPLHLRVFASDSVHWPPTTGHWPLFTKRTH